MPNALDRQQQLLAGQSRFPPARGRDDDTSSVLSWNTVQSSAAADPETDDELPLQGNVVVVVSLLRPQLQQLRQLAIWWITPMRHQWIASSGSSRSRLAIEDVEEFAGSSLVLTTRSTWSFHTISNKSGSGAGERSILILDHRDQRLQSPYQGWLVDEILTNAHAKVNILSDSKLVRSPTTGYHFNVFLLKTLDNFKLVFAGSMTSYGSVPCGKWETATARVFSHSAFQPFCWPVMRDDSPTWVDLKVKLEGDLLMHLSFGL